MPRDQTAVFYISGHGFGHAVRQIEVINALGARRPDVRIAIRTAAPASLFSDTLTRAWPVAAGDTDTGVTQVDSLTVDVAASVARAWDFHRTLDDRAAAEARWLAAQGATLVVADIPPLAFAAAALAGLPAVGVGNFTWDWIYAHYRQRVTLPPELVPRLGAAYANAAAAFRLPMAAGFETFPVVTDTPLVARHAGRPAEETRAALGLSPDRTAVLLSFGRYGLDTIDWARVRQHRDLQVVLTNETFDPGPPAAATAAPAGAAGDVVRTVDLRRFFEQGFQYADLVAAVDVVLSKPGYGIIAECAANDTALVYTSRGDFAEYAVLVAAMPSLLRCGYLSQAELLSGEWVPTLGRVLAQPAVPKPRSDGAEVVAQGLDGYLAD